MKFIKFTKISIVLIVISLMVTAGVWSLLRFGYSKEVRNVLLISIDTCRADYLSCYGYHQRTTPNIDALAREGVLFANAYAPAPVTLPSHCSMLTGLIPPRHGVHDNVDYKLGQSDDTLAEILGRNGFTTGAVVSSFVLDSMFGLSRGFDSYNDRFEKPYKTVSFNERRGDETTNCAIKWLDRCKNDRFFLFLHYFDPHRSYDPPEPFASRFKDSPYAGEIAYVDYCIGRVLEKLKDLGLYDSTLVIITGDHGEMLGEHGEGTHGYFIYQSAIRVPLIIKLPGRHKSKTIRTPVGLIDIVPTVCTMLEFKVPDDVQGENLSGYFSGRKPENAERLLYCQSMGPTKEGANSLMGVVSGRWKYIQTTRPELYDIVEDPHETNDLAKQQPNRARILQDHLRRILEDQVLKHDSGSRAELDDESRKRLESLGYIADIRVEERFDFDQSKKDPKDLIGIHTNRAKAQGFNNLGYELAGKGRLAKAIDHYEEALRIDPHFALAHNNLGNALAAQGKFDEAFEHFVKAVEVDPDFEKAHNNLGNVFLVRGDFDKAYAHYSEAVRIKPDYAIAHNGLGTVMATRGRINQAIEHFSRAVELDPDYVKAVNNLERMRKKNIR